MARVLRPFLDRWRLCALLAALAMLAIAHAFETFGGYAPCHLCLKQREVYWAAAALAFVFMIIVRMPGGPRFRQATCWVLALVFAGEAGIAIYHAGAEWKFWPGPTACSSAAGAGTVSVAAMTDLLNGAHIRPPACDQAPWVFGGLSMAGWNAVIALGLVAMSVLAAFRERSKG